MSIVIGIDPGINTGVAVFIDGRLTRLETIHPAEVAAYIQAAQPSRVVFEDSRLQSHVWTNSHSRAAAAKLARNVGEVDAWCRLIAHACGKLGIPAHGVSPKGKGAKMDADSFRELTGWQGRTNAHERDAAMVCWPYRRAHA